MQTQFMGHTIKTRPDESIEPGHQVIMVGPADEGARAILFTITGTWPTGVIETDEGDIHTWVAAPHDEGADERLIALVDLCADLRFTAPNLCQLQLRLELDVNA